MIIQIFINAGVCITESLSIFLLISLIPVTRFAITRLVFACSSISYATVGVEMPGGMPVRLKAGQAVIYNNNLIHMGYTRTMEVPRRTLHMGYYSAAHPPTWHFYLLNSSLLTPEYLQTLNPTMHRMMNEYLECKRQYPNMSDTWKYDYNFPGYFRQPQFS